MGKEIYPRVHRQFSPLHLLSEKDDWYHLFRIFFLTQTYIGFVNDNNDNALGLPLG